MHETTISIIDIKKYKTTVYTNGNTSFYLNIMFFIFELPYYVTCCFIESRSESALPDSRVMVFFFQINLSEPQLLSEMPHIVKQLCYILI